MYEVSMRKIEKVADGEMNEIVAGDENDGNNDE